jgi:hypothetical protein
MTLSASNKVGQLSASSCCRDLESARRFSFFPFAITEQMSHMLHISIQELNQQCNQQIAYGSNK